MEQRRKQYDIALIGGDARIAYMATILAEKGYRVITYGMKKLEENIGNPATCADSVEEAIEEAMYIIGGIPLFKNGKVAGGSELHGMSQEAFYRCLEMHQVVFGGVIPTQFESLCKERSIVCYDFMRDESLAIFNAIATAEGTILEALKNKETNIHGSKSLVLGYGRCAKILCEKLRGMGANVTVCARNEIQLAYASAYGDQVISISQLEREISQFEYIYNTIPAKVFCQSALSHVRRDALIIDIASGDGGIDYACANRLGIRAIQCLGLPGKYAPKISASGLVDFVVRKIEQGKEICNGDKG
ncbi:MAG: dipicolinate synthase subunit DpsA [Eubacteriales bacterium]|nr:dipicolinate synthase subunit DpsA [Eubacteriales bacterium]